jgi:hypothetical protein
LAGLLIDEFPYKQRTHGLPGGMSSLQAFDYALIGDGCVQFAAARAEELQYCVGSQIAS